MKYLNNFLLLCSKDTTTSGGVKKGRKKKIDNYSTTPETVEIVKKEEKFDYDNAKVILDVRHLKQFFHFGKGEYN